VKFLSENESFSFEALRTAEVSVLRSEVFRHWPGVSQWVTTGGLSGSVMERIFA
jgi:hypothetical protein